MNAFRIVILVIALLTLAVSSCNKEQSEFIGIIGDIDFHGLVIERLPVQGKGHWSITPSELEFTWNEGVIKIVDNENGTFTVTAPRSETITVYGSAKLHFGDQGELTVSR